MMENKALNSPQNLKWYQGWRNIITLACFVLFVWPLAVIIMWPLANWGRKTKLIITLGVVVTIGIVLVPFLIGPIYKNLDVSNIPNIMATASRVGWVVILATLIISISLSILFKMQNKSIKKIWLFTGAILIFTFAIMFIVLVSGASSMYNLTGQGNPAPLISATPAETLRSNRKIYRNSQYGYQVEYPQEYFPEELGGGTSVVFHTQVSPKVPLRIDLMQDANPNSETINTAWLQNFSEKLHGTLYEKLPVETIEEISIDRIKGIKITQPLLELDEISAVIFIPLDKDILSVNFSFPDDSVVNQNIVNDFISGFRFLEK